MEDILVGLLKKERVSSIMKSVESHYKDLHCISVFYVRDGGYYIARSFYTDAWIAMRPVGPEVSSDGNIIMDSVHDIATIIKFADVLTWKAQPHVTSEMLEEIYRLVIEQSRSFVEDLFGIHVDLIHNINFTFTPFPQMIVTLQRGGRWLGAVSVNMQGDVRLLNRTDPIAELLVNEINRGCMKSIYKEFVRCLPEAYK